MALLLLCPSLSSRSNNLFWMPRKKREKERDFIFKMVTPIVLTTTQTWNMTSCKYTCINSSTLFIIPTSVHRVSHLFKDFKFSILRKLIMCVNYHIAKLIRLNNFDNIIMLSHIHIWHISYSKIINLCWLLWFWNNSRWAVCSSEFIAHEIYKQRLFIKISFLIFMISRSLKNEWYSLEDYFWRSGTCDYIFLPYFGLVESILF